MINWWPVLAYGLWLLGLALLLASLGYSLWLTRQEGTGWRQQLRRPQFLRPFWLSLALVGFGLIGISGQTWERLLWLFVSLYCLTILWRLRRA